MSDRLFPPDGHKMTKIINGEEVPCIAWSNTKAPLFTNGIYTASSGKEARVAFETFPRWRFTWMFNALWDSDDGPYDQTLTSMNSLSAPQPFYPNTLNPTYTPPANHIAGMGDMVDAVLGFFMLHRGSFESFLIQDTQDWQLVDQPIHPPGGAKGTPNERMQVIRTVGNLFIHPIYDLDNPSNLVLKENGTPIPAGQWTLENNGVIKFTTARTPGSSITITGKYYYRVRFEEDEFELEEVREKLWRTQEISMVSVKPL